MRSPQSRVLVVDDERPIRRALHTSLSTLGFEIEEASGGEEALSLIRNERYEAVLLDINMPDMSGIEACRAIRDLSPRLPIVIVTVRDSQEDKIEALNAGADDYVTKPFHLGELMARVRAAVRRSHATQEEMQTVILIGDIELDVERRQVRKKGKAVHLTPKEFSLLQFLMSQAGKPIAHARLLTTVWGDEYGSELEYLRTFIRQLREKLEDDPSRPEYLLTEAHVGYRFSEGHPKLRRSSDQFGS
jgi:two-component system, OmpR family, KDP operon response regulator KdpE